MHLYLVQHGVAKSSEEDPERPLSDAGRAEVEAMASWASRAGLPVDSIVHSGKLRAAQTAGVLGAALAPAEGVEAREGLAPNDDPTIAVRTLGERPTMLVGHLPHLARLAGLLLAGDPEATPVAFRNAGIVCLAHTGKRWVLEWAVTPEQVARGL